MFILQDKEKLFYICCFPKYFFFLHFPQLWAENYENSGRDLKTMTWSQMRGPFTTFFPKHSERILAFSCKKLILFFVEKYSRQLDVSWV